MVDVLFCGKMLSTGGKELVTVITYSPRRPVQLETEAFKLLCAIAHQHDIFWPKERDYVCTTHDGDRVCYP